MSDAHHRVDFFELPMTDLEVAKEFYGKVFGWTFVDYGGQYVDIKGAGIAGGFRPSKTPGPRGGALVILYSDDLEASETAIIDAGGSIVERHDFPGGRRFQFLDPCGNELAVWTKV